MNDALVNTPPPAPFILTQDQIALKDASERFFMDRFHPLNARMDEEDWWPDEVFPALGEMGYLGLTVAGEFGGQDLDLLTAGLVCEALNKANPAIGLSWVAHDNLCLNNIYRNANEDQRRRYLPRLCDGSAAGALALTEPGAGSDALGSMRTSAKRVGDKYILNGRKLFITNGPIADILLVYAKTAPELGAKGISAFIVEKDFPGFSVAQRLDKMGFRGSPTGELLFDDCAVPAENLVGEENNGVTVVMSGLDLERAMVAPMCVGIAERTLEVWCARRTGRR